MDRSWGGKETSEMEEGELMRNSVDRSFRGGAVGHSLSDLEG